MVLVTRWWLLLAGVVALGLIGGTNDIYESRGISFPVPFSCPNSQVHGIIILTDFTGEQS